MTESYVKRHQAAFWLTVLGAVVAGIVDGVVTGVFEAIGQIGANPSSASEEGAALEPAESTTSPSVTSSTDPPSRVSESPTIPLLTAEPSTTRTTVSPRPPEPTPPQPARYYLADLDYVEVEIEGRPGRCTGGCTGFDRGAEKIGATTYPQSYVMRMDSDGDRSTSSWNALQACTTFEATLGLTNDSSTTAATFTISLDDAPPQTLAVVETGDAAPVSVALGGVIRFTIAAYVTGAEPENADSVWGDASMVCERGSLDG